MNLNNGTSASTPSDDNNLCYYQFGEFEEVGSPIVIPDGLCFW